MTEGEDASTVWQTIHADVQYDIKYPPHIERSKDPYISVFEATRRQLMKEDATCWRCGGAENLQAHHLIQWAYFPLIDMEKVRKDFPSFTGTTNDDLMKFLNGPQNIRLLCQKCHTGDEGVHNIPDPLWRVRRYIIDGVPTDTVQVMHRNPLHRVVNNAAARTMKLPTTLRRLMR